MTKIEKFFLIIAIIAGLGWIACSPGVKSSTKSDCINYWANRDAGLSIDTIASDPLYCGDIQ